MISGIRRPEDRLRVVQVSPFLDPAKRSAEDLLSAWPTLVQVAEAVARAGAEVTVLQPAAADDFVQSAGVRYLFVRERPPSRVRRRAGLWASPLPRRLARKLADLDADVIHFQSLSFPLHLSLIGKSARGTPILVQDHGDQPPPRWRAGLHRRGLRAAAGVSFTHREQVRPFVEAGVLPEAIRIFEVLESSSWFAPGDQGQARRATGLAGDPCLLWIGHLDRNKDPLAVLTALAAAAPHLPDLHLWCCYGSAGLLAVVRDRIRSSDVLRDRVHLLGRVPHEQVELLCRAADFLITGSHSEGSGYAVLEAMACGAAPLVTDIPSFRRITDEGTVGALSSPGDSVAMTQALLEWSAMDRRELRRRVMGHFQERLSFDTVGKELRAAYEGVRTTA